MDLNWFDLFLERSFLPLYGITVIVSILRYRKYYDTPLKYFPILLMYTFLNELLGALIRYNEFEFVFNEVYRNNNLIIYNIYSIVFFLYFFYVYYMYIKEQLYRKIIAVGSGLFILVAILNPFFQAFLYESQVFTYLTGSLVLIVILLLFFIYTRETFGSWFRDRSIMSWLSLGMFIFYLLYMPIKWIRYERAAEQLNDIPMVRRLHLILILIMYCSIVIGFLRMGKERK